MRIALLVPGGVSRDGEHRIIPAILWLVARLSASHDVQIFVPNQEPEEGSWPLRGAVVHNVTGRRWELGAMRRLLTLHAQKRFDVVHALWARGPGEVALAAARLTRLPVLVHVSGGELVRFPEIDFGSRALRRGLARFVLRRADRVTAASRYMLELAARSGVRAVRVPLGVDTSCWVPSPPRPRPPDRPLRLVSVGSLTPVKGHSTLLEAVALLREEGRGVLVDLVGEDTSGGALRRLVRARGLEESVIVHGFLPQKATVPVVRLADLMVVASLHEAGPVAMLEAAAVGVPTVGSEVGHVAEWAPDAAIAVRPGDARALVEAIRMIADDDELRLTIAARAQARALQEDADWTAERFGQLYGEVVAARGDGRRA